MRCTGGLLAAGGGARRPPRTAARVVEVLRGQHRGPARRCSRRRAAQPRVVARGATGTGRPAWATVPGCAARSAAVAHSGVAAGMPVRTAPASLPLWNRARAF